MSDEQIYPTRGRMIVAAATPPSSRSPFNRGKPIIKVDDDLYVRVRDWVETAREPRVTGQAMTAQEYATLTGAEHFMVLPTPLVPLNDSMVWVFRSNHPRRDAALAEIKSDVFESSTVFDGPEDSKIILVRAGEDLLEQWSSAARFKALGHAGDGAWDAAELEANLAFATSPTMRTDHLGLMIVIYEHQRRITRVEGMMTMALRSRGPAFADAVAAERDRFRARFP